MKQRGRGNKNVTLKKDGDLYRIEIWLAADHQESMAVTGSELVQIKELIEKEMETI